MSSPSEQPLVAAVLVLTYERAFRSDKYMGRAVHTLALELIGQINPALSAEIHDTDGMLPLTVSDLFQSDAHHHWFRLTALRADLADVLHELTQPLMKPYRLDGWTLEAALATQHDWSGATTAADLLQTYWKPAKTLRLQFASATSFKSLGLYRPLPEAGLVFKSLYERWRQLVNQPPPFAPSPFALEAFARDYISLTDFELQSVTVPMKSGTIPAFCGQATYRVENQNAAVEHKARLDPVTGELFPQFRDHRNEYASLLNLLAQFSFYSGVGIKTAQGMGMVRPLPVR